MEKKIYFLLEVEIIDLIRYLRFKSFILGGQSQRNVWNAYLYHLRGEEEEDRCDELISQIFDIEIRN